MYSVAMDGAFTVNGKLTASEDNANREISIIDLKFPLTQPVVMLCISPFSSYFASYNLVTGKILNLRKRFLLIN